MPGDDARRIRTLRDRADPSRTHVERLADQVASSLGTPGFLGVNLVWFVVWYLWRGHDGVLSILISLEAIVLTVFVLIAQKHSARLDEMRAELDLEVNLIAEEELTKLLQIVKLLAEKQGIDLSADRDLKEMVSPTNVAEIETELHNLIAPTKGQPEPPSR
ncbi:hypothetical protein BH11MYX1_BH11MYX1_58180 [soil metagenome]